MEPTTAAAAPTTTAAAPKISAAIETMDVDTRPDFDSYHALAHGDCCGRGS